MIIPHDDLPIHQSAAPLSVVANGHPDAFERYTFMGQDREGGLFFAATLGIHPNRRVVDGSFSVLDGQIQRSIHVSGRLDADRCATAVGPMVLEIIEPLRSHRLRLATPELGLAVDLVFDTTTTTVQGPGQAGFSQWGSWNGSIALDGRAVDISPAAHTGLRRRRWGTARFDRARTAPDSAPSRTLPQHFELNAALDVEGAHIGFGLEERSDGFRVDEHAVLVVNAPIAEPRALQRIDHDICWRPGTRWIDHATIAVGTPLTGRHSIELDSVGIFLMKGLGFTDTAWPHGSYKGELVVGTDSWDTSRLDPEDVSHLHAIAVVSATWMDPSGDQHSGVGFIEHLALGDHMPTGLSGFTRGAGSGP